jgi:hypothetical protein
MLQPSSASSMGKAAAASSWHCLVCWFVCLGFHCCGGGMGSINQSINHSLTHSLNRLDTEERGQSSVCLSVRVMLSTITINAHLLDVEADEGPALLLVRRPHLLARVAALNMWRRARCVLCLYVCVGDDGGGGEVDRERQSASVVQQQLNIQ